ncbi:MAG: hypothetical protein M0004_09670 [Actinomycetota bacterium]|nr:hypothetical protein [Actinomycetota bacterium]
MRHLARAGLFTALLLGATALPPSAASWAARPTSSPGALAHRLLALAPLPPGARPCGARGGEMAKAPGELVGIAPVTDADRCVTATSGPALVQAYLRGHLAKGATLSSIGSGSGRGAVQFFVSEALSIDNPHVYLAHLVYTARTAARDTTVLRVDAQVVWVPLRPAGARLSSSGHATLTGYRQLSLAAAPRGPVREAIGQAALAHLAALANSLTEGPSHLECMEDTILYRLQVRTHHRTEQLVGHQCGAEVALSINGRLLAPLSDRHCALLQAVQQLLPSAARASRQASAGCASR